MTRDEILGDDDFEDSGLLLLPLRSRKVALTLVKGTSRDEIEKLSDDDLNLMVATEVMGQTDISHPGFFWEEGTTEDGQDGWDGWYCPRCHADKGNTGKCVKKYASDIAAAMQVVEKLQGEGNDVSINYTHDTDRWDIVFWNKDIVGLIRDVGISGFLPLAICRAALLAKMQP